MKAAPGFGPAYRPAATTCMPAANSSSKWSTAILGAPGCRNKPTVSV